MGIKETIDAVRFLGLLVSNIVEAAADGQFNWWEVTKFQEAAMALPAAVNGYADIPKELKDMSTDEAIAVNAAFAEAMDLPGDDYEEIVEEGVTLALATAAYINKVKELRASRAEQTEA